MLPISPLVDGPSEEEQVDKPEPNPKAEHRPRTILVVDDDPLILMGTVAMLDDLGHIAVSAMSGEDALSKLRSRSDIDIMITDHAMPKMTGLQLASLVAQEWPELPIVLGTGYAELPTGEVTALPRLAKPFLQDQLANAIAKYSNGDFPN